MSNNIQDRLTSVIATICRLENLNKWFSYKELSIRQLLTDNGISTFDYAPIILGVLKDNGFIFIEGDKKKVTWKIKNIGFLPDYKRLAGECNFRFHQLQKERLLRKKTSDNNPLVPKTNNRIVKKIENSTCKTKVIPSISLRTKVFVLQNNLLYEGIIVGKYLNLKEDSMSYDIIIKTDAVISSAILGQDFFSTIDDLTKHLVKNIQKTPQL